VVCTFQILRLSEHPDNIFLITYFLFFFFYLLFSVLLTGEEENCALHNYGRPEESKCSIFDSVVCGESCSYSASILYNFYVL